MSGCTIDTVPSNARASLHASRKCASGICQWRHRGRLVRVRAQMHAHPHLVHLLAELQIRGRAVNRIAADDEQRVDLTGRHRRGQLANRLQLIDRMRLDRIRIENRLPGIAERRVHRVREGMHDRRLAFAGHDDARLRDSRSDRFEPLRARPGLRLAANLRD